MCKCLVTRIAERADGLFCRKGGRRDARKWKGERVVDRRGRADCLVKHDAVGGDAVAPLLEEALTLWTVFPDRLAERVLRSQTKQRACSPPLSSLQPCEH